MCAIVDANVVHEVFGSQEKQPAGAGKGFREWLNSDKGKLVIGGKLKEELEENSNYCIWAQQATLSGKLINKSKDCINQKTKEVKSSSELKSNDPHIIALAQVSGARLLFSNDKDLQKDFKNPAIINEPRGKVYSTISNQSFTDAKKKLLDRHHCKIVN